ncbi:2,3,4,5-tetrahydropyridine-2,6-dicarboxylate N-succinyltransferase [Luteimonas sp. MC1895]|uniref:2,3,4,5-tetrahydropyridine-2,6-dicarboxylate N-succinyltransferase n=1 Tax=Luteimonas sp. MC1895 TaxID=2819513 RepID=UPI0018F061AD|nr:2,3,4,5-tetrahydropyridine-2,6-dicarboxylate N-succinyltransferase [Luteimonas sp. MC1895]MBJ6977963.1 2,3,4,5-tetrahydropyridine-2,6-dicarboxylate N-succinyltransferase [Luteimonas sp. MC1895]
MSIAKKARAKKALATGSAAGKAAAKPAAAKKSASKKSAAKKSVAKAPVAKKSVAKSPVAKNVATAKAATKKVASKKVAAKKSVARNPVAKKVPTKKSATKPAAKVTATAGGMMPAASGASRVAGGAGAAEAPAHPHVADADRELAFMIDSAWARRSMLTPEEIEGSTRLLVDQAIEGLEAGRLRVAEPDGKGGWHVNEWLKKAVLLYFRVQEMELGEQYPAPYWDKIPMRFEDFDEAAFRKLGARVLPGAIARRGAHIGRDVVLMPSFVNIGAWIGAGTMVDTWATVGSCAQVGKHCHISGGAGIGGVLEPLQAAPTIIEDHVFVGARSEVVEGVIVGHHSVIGMGVFLGQSTRIYNRMTGETSYGVVPPGSVVVAGSLPAADGSHSLYCAVIVKQVDARTRAKTSVNELLRGHAQ